MDASSGEKKWNRVLYEKQDVPDNYVDQSFLNSRKKNSFVRHYSYQKLVASSAVLLQQFCIICAFVVIWWYMSDKLVAPQLLTCISIPNSVVLYMIYFKITDSGADHVKEKILEDFKTAILLLSYTALLSPVLKTLTHTISTDTIYTMTFLMLLGHFVFHDYGPSGILVSRAASLNMAVFAAVCLASRLDSTTHAFATVILALQFFGLWPILRRRLVLSHPRCSLAVTALLFISVFFSLLYRSTYSAVLFALVSAAMLLLCPAILISLQPHKDTIHGPWDEAIISH